MAGILFPVDNFGQLAGKKLRQALSVFLGGASPARPLGAASGVRRGTGTPVSVTSTTWSVGPHAGVLDVQVDGTAGPYPFSFDTAQTGPLDPAGAFTRIDILVAQLNDPTQGQSGTPSVQIVRVVGTAANTQPPTPASSMLEAVINVPASGQGAPTVTWVAPPLPGNDLYVAPVSAVASMTTGTIDLTNQITVPARSYAQVLHLDFSALIYGQTAATDEVELFVLVNGAATRWLRGTGNKFCLSGSQNISVAANTTVTLKLQLTKVSGTGTTTVPVDAGRRWLECLAVPA